MSLNCSLQTESTFSSVLRSKEGYTTFDFSKKKKNSAFSECKYCRGTGRNVYFMDSYLFNEVHLLRAKRQNSGN